MHTGTENHFLRDPRHVVIERATGRTVYVFIGDTPVASAVRSGRADTLREYYGPSWKQKLAIGSGDKTGGEDIDDIEALLAEPAVEVAPSKPQRVGGVEYVTDVHIFPEDTFDEIREKIYLVTDIPPYRQHLYWLERGRARTMYNLFADGIYTVDIRALDTPTSSMMAGLPIDKSLYDARERVRVEVRDQFMIASDADSTYYVRDLADYTRTHAQLAEIVNDTYRFDLLYYGVIIKYWPMLMRECFHDYIMREAELPLKYPDLAKSKTELAIVYRHEAAIVTRDYRNAHRVLSKCAYMTTAITQMTALMRTPRTAIHIRNLFDRLSATKTIPEIHAYVERDGKKYLLRKQYTRSDEVAFPPGATLRQGLTMAVALDASRYLFLNIRSNGHYYIRTTWNEEDELGFDAATRVMKSATDGIVRTINGFGKYVFLTGGPLPFVTKRAVDYHGLNVCMFWKRVMLESTFRLVRALWDQYMRARITTPRNVQQYDKYEFTFRKGMHQFDTNSIDRILNATNNTILLNRYAHLSNNVVKQKWDQNYGGRIVRMDHRTTDLRFEILDVRETEFAIFHRYLAGFIYAASIDERVKASMVSSRSYKDVKKLRKLREQDPELFNLKKHGSKKVYSTICQNQHQPLIYTPDEIRDMSAHDVKRLTKYWNFTLNKPAYYGCPSADYPHLSFMVGVHPKHYCLPCCNKRPHDDAASRRARLNALCMQNHIVTETDIAADAGDVSRHVMAYGKSIDPGRLSRVPPELGSLLFNTLDVGKYYLFGVGQHSRGANNIGCLFAIAAAVNEKPAALADRIIASAAAHFTVIVGGSLIGHFRDETELADAWRDMITGELSESKPFTQWPELIIEAAHFAGINVMTLIDQGNGSIVLHVGGGMLADVLQGGSRAPHVIVLKRKDEYYPVFAIDIAEFFRDGSISARTYATDTPTIALLYSMVKFGARSHEVGIVPGYDAISRIVSVAKKYVGRRNQCYGVDVVLDGETSYLPVEYSVVTADGVPSDFGPPKSTLMSRAVVDLLNSQLPAEYARITVVTSEYDEVNAKILARAAPVPDARSQRLGEALYTNYQYRLFLLEFINYVRAERNDTVRAELKDLIAQTNFKRDITEFKRRLRQLVPPSDLTVIFGQLGAFYSTLDRPALFAEIDSTAYEFDRTTMNRLRALESDDLIAELRSVANQFAVEREIDASKIDFPNIYMPCADTDAVAYCDGSKLIVNESLDSLVSLLAADIKNSLKQRYLFDLVDTTIDWFSFDARPTETVTVYRLGE